jgi:hypothetical protein
VRQALAIFIPWTVAVAFAFMAGWIWHSTPTADIACYPDGRMQMNISVHGMDPKAVNDSLYYLCDQNTIGFGYANPQVRRVSADGRQHP